MLNIILTASHDAYQFKDASLDTSEIKCIARSNANRRYPRGTKVLRGLYKYTFLRKVSYYEDQSWIEEINSYR